MKNIYAGFFGRTNAASYMPTPATIRVTALLGDLCSDNTDCVIKYSICIDGGCVCLPNYSESPDRKECIADIASTGEYKACISSPCHHRSACVDLPSGAFTCICGQNYAGQYCQNEVIVKQYKIPAFDGKSYVKMKPLKAYHKLSIEIEFKTYTNDGIILYNQQQANGLGDFVSLAIIKGFVEFRYNLGNGPIIITSLNKVQLKQFHRVIIKRYHRDGMLKLDEGEDIAGQSMGSLKALDLLEDAFIGYVPSNTTRVYDNIGTDVGLVGCIKKLRIGRKTVELHEKRDEWIIHAHAVHECDDNPCSSIPCQNGGTCKVIDFELYRCECDQYYTGEFCENFVDPCSSNPCGSGSTCASFQNGKHFCTCLSGHIGRDCETVDGIDISIPEFNGSSFIEFPPLKGVSKTFFIEISFLSVALNGLILYSGQSKTGKGDFISLNLIRGHIQFRFNLGSGVANITSKEIIVLGKWYSVKLSRNGREGMLQINNSTVIRGHSPPSLIELNIELPLYIGSVLSWQEVHRLSGASKGLRGAIQKITLDGEILPISGTIIDCSYLPINNAGCGHNIRKYDGDPCPLSKNPCKNKGLCIPNLSDYVCECHSNYRGSNCQYEKKEYSPIKFTGSTNLEYQYPIYQRENITNNMEYSDYLIDSDLTLEPNAFKEAENEAGSQYTYYDEENNYSLNYNLLGKSEEINSKHQLRLKTVSSDALILCTGKSKNLHVKYFFIALVDGYPEVSYNVGSRNEFWTIRAKTKIDDGEWHTIHVKRKKRVSIITVDENDSTKREFEKDATLLTASTRLWIGGTSSLPPGLPTAYYKSFVGCIQLITINNNALNMLKTVNPERIEFCHDNEI